MCHNAKNHPEKVDLSSYKALMASGEKAKTVTPGHPESSGLIVYVDGTRKPRMPMGKPPMKAADIAALQAWVKSGAKP